MSINTVLIIVAVVIIALIAWAISTYNQLVSLRNRVKNGWAQIDVQLKRRADLIPNLVNTVKGYANHESQVFENVTKARAQVSQTLASGSIEQRAAVESELSRALVSVLATAEAYPELKANANFIELQKELQSIETKISYARQFYNDVVLKLNTMVESFPSNIIASIFHFEQATYFEVEESAKAVPTVSF
ncbi:MAG: LemA family protein [Bifidobacteriaceae bacterium]|nr:LemA family protein [Bifidobacteriaceae bacterium]